MRFAQGFFVAIALASSSIGATASTNGGRVRGQPSERGGARRSMQKQTKHSSVEEQQHGRVLEPESGFVSVVCEDSPLKKCGNFVIDTNVNPPIECCVDTPYNPASQGCCNGVVFATATNGCCGGDIYARSTSLCCGDEMDGNVFSETDIATTYGDQYPSAEGIPVGICCGTNLVPSSEYCCGDDIIYDESECGEFCCYSTFVVEGEDSNACGCELDDAGCDPDETSACITIAGKGKSGNPEPDVDETLCFPNEDLEGDIPGYSVPIGESVGKGNTLAACGGCPW